ncbi:hypothetical protein HNI00_21550 [Thermoleptolyngbya oregonensis NK1-22]|uniref:Uncharacterized protein n=1 Tax=Thermoleptolyngbya oregonensis NK1-22 TaxID=2547457 RepID=A0AA96YCZ7_9CYAN|nr:hypothetical protein [Thermoleptolyngbya oregonensis]WOB45428.1 hypothetical protein HNI00_21550 [Thermoleptolyngbya oregonensis NK1-22]
MKTWRNQAMLCAASETDRQTLLRTVWVQTQTPGKDSRQGIAREKLGASRRSPPSPIHSRKLPEDETPP